MALYEVIYEGTVRETYLVEAESEDEARGILIDTGMFTEIGHLAI